MSSITPIDSESDTMEQPSWKKTKLSLERPYKDDKGERIPVLLDITPDGVQVFEPYVTETSPYSIANQASVHKIPSNSWVKT
jgi:hypothetical protein